MQKIILLCAQGMSTGVLVTKMRKEAETQNLKCEIRAMAIDNVQKAIEEADVILLGPQIRYELENVKSIAGDIPVVVIDMISYGMLDGKKVLNTAIKLMN